MSEQLRVFHLRARVVVLPPTTSAVMLLSNLNILRNTTAFLRIRPVYRAAARYSTSPSVPPPRLPRALAHLFQIPPVQLK